MKKKIVVDLSDRTLKAYEDDKVVYTFTVLTGKTGHATTVGKYKILSKDKNHKSRAYNNAPMNFAMFFSEDGKAIHESENYELRIKAPKKIPFLFDAAGTHGCVGLSHDDAATLWDWSPKGTPVIVQE